MNRTPTDAEIEYAERWMSSRNIAPFVLEDDRWFLPGQLPFPVWAATNERHSAGQPYDTQSAAVAAVAVALAECREACAVKGGNDVSVEQMIREIMDAMRKDQGFFERFTAGETEFTAADLVFPANALVIILREELKRIRADEREKCRTIAMKIRQEMLDDEEPYFAIGAEMVADALEGETT